MIAEQQLAGTLRELHQRLRRAGARSIGFPGATDIDFRVVQPFHDSMINNIGDPEYEGRESRHTKEMERAVVRDVLGLFGGDTGACWGYVTQSGSTEGNQFGMWLARERHPDAVLYHSVAAHYSVGKAARFLGMNADAVTVEVDARGEMRYDALARAASAHRHRPAVVVATVGTTMTEAVDDVARIHAALTEAGVTRRHLHVDGALAGVPVALDGGPVAHLLAARGSGARTAADSVCVSGHKFFGTPHVSGVAMARREHVNRVARGIDYIDGLDGTISGSRSGHSVIELWYALNVIGLDGHRRRTAGARAVAAYTHDRLHAAGWETWRHDHAFTVMLHDPPTELLRRWALPVSDGWAHVLCAPGVGTPVIDAFLAELGPRPASPDGLRRLVRPHLATPTPYARPAVSAPDPGRTPDLVPVPERGMSPS